MADNSNPPEEKKRALRTVTRDNVIFANFGAKSRVREADSEEQEARATRKSSSREYSAAAKRLRDFVEQATDSGRIKRGRDYHRNKHVLNPHISNGSISADVAGSQNLPFQVSISFPYRSTDDISTVTTELAATKGGIEKAREGIISEVVLSTLMAERANELRFRCDCPDHTVCCKHAVAVAYHVADMLDSDPGLVFALRGLNLIALEQSVTMVARDINAMKASQNKNFFWNGEELPEVPSPKKSPALEDSDEMMLHKAMRMCSLTSVDELKAVADIEDMYDFLVNKH